MFPSCFFSGSCCHLLLKKKRERKISFRLVGRGGEGFLPTPHQGLVGPWTPACFSLFWVYRSFTHAIGVLTKHWYLPHFSLRGLCRQVLLVQKQFSLCFMSIIQLFTWYLTSGILFQEVTPKATPKVTPKAAGNVYALSVSCDCKPELKKILYTCHLDNYMLCTVVIVYLELL